MQGFRLDDRQALLRDVAVARRRRGEDDALYLRAARLLEHVDGADDVLLAVECRRLHRDVHRRLPREMHDRIKMPLIKDSGECRIVDIHLDALDALRQIVTRPRAEVVEHRHLLALGQQFSHKMGADEAGTTRH